MSDDQYAPITDVDMIEKITQNILIHDYVNEWLDENNYTAEQRKYFDLNKFVEEHIMNDYDVYLLSENKKELIQCYIGDGGDSMCEIADCNGEDNGRCRTNGSNSLYYLVWRE